MDIIYLSIPRLLTRLSLPSSPVSPNSFEVCFLRTHFCPPWLPSSFISAQHFHLYFCPAHYFTLEYTFISSQAGKAYSSVLCKYFSASKALLYHCSSTDSCLKASSSTASALISKTSPTSLTVYRPTTSGSTINTTLTTWDRLVWCICGFHISIFTGVLPNLPSIVCSMF